ncbi:MAG: glycosyltransferase [Candidatus Omnitrophica bacterium]|nr:glycosyltransferase [Candidatus Omnitrophota bacterium]
MSANKIADHYDSISQRYARFSARRRYYTKLREKQYRYFIPEGKRVLEVGCGSGDILASLKPCLGVGVDLSPQMIEIARASHPELSFIVGPLAALPPKDKFDYIILSGLLGELDDIEDFLFSLRAFCSADTRIIIEYHNYLWQYFLKISGYLGLSIPRLEQNWLTYRDILNFLTLTDFEGIKKERSVLCPIQIWGISWLINKFLSKLPLFNALSLNNYIIARPLFDHGRDFSVTILVPCRNEKGNVEAAVTRTPAFGTKQEFIFVEGHSSDGTYEEVERIIKKYPQKDIKLYKQPGKGKGDAVHFGFGHAQGDILMILDADLTMPPEDLPKFYHAIRTNKGEFINGCRLVYPMEKQAMRFLNLVANKFFGLFFSWLLGQRFKDTLCGTKVIFRHHYNELVANRSYFGDFDPFGDFDLIFGAIKLNLKVIEVPIRYREREYGTTQIQRFRHGLLLLRMCWVAMKKIKFL